MKIERIDDNSIKCTLTNLDLSSRNMNIRDMTYGSPAARKLFSEMMQRAQEEVGFMPDSTPLMIEAIPLKGGSIQLIISKVDDPEELDTRFSKFTQELMSQGGLFNQLASQMLEGAQNLLKQISVEEDPTKTELLEEKPEEEETAPGSDIRIFLFDDLEQVCHAARAVSQAYAGKNSLYKDEAHKQYYLTLHTEGADREALSRAANLLAEYGEKVNGDALSEAYYQEHFLCIRKDDAIQKLKKL